MKCFEYKLRDLNRDILDQIGYTIEENPISENIKLLVTGICERLVIYESNNIILYNGFYYKMSKKEIISLLNTVKNILDHDLDHAGYYSYNEYLVAENASFEMRWG